MTRRARGLMWIFGTLAAIVLVALGAAVLTLRSGWFREQVRARMVREIEKASGGKTEVGSFEFDWRTMQARVKNFVLHGKERAGEPVFLRAESVTVDLKIVSAFKKEIDLATGIVEKPEFHLVVYPDGTTNLPAPAVRRQGTFVDTILKLKIRRYEIRNGVVEFKEERVPLDIRGDNLDAALDYDVAKKLYQGHVSSRQLHVETTAILPLIADFDTDLTFDRGGIRFPNMRLVWPHSRVDLAGEIENWAAPRGTFDVRSNISLAELGGILRVPVEHRGEASFDGKAELAFAPRFAYDIRGKLAARGLAVRLNGVELTGAALEAQSQVNAKGVLLPHFTVNALGGRFEGRAAIPEYKRFEVEGEANGLAIAQLSQFGTAKKLPWSGVVSGPAKLSGEFVSSGVRDFVASGNLIISQAPGAIPVEGVADFVYDQEAGTVELGNSRISTPHSRVVVSGTLGRTLDVSARTSDLNDLLPALRLISDTAPEDIPVKLEAGGSAAAEGTVSGPLSDPQIGAKVSLSSFTAAGQRFDSLAGDFDLDKARLTGRNIDLRQGAMQVSGGGGLALANWRAVDSSGVSASLKLVNADVKKLLTEAGSTVDLTGLATAAAKVDGTFGSPHASIQLTVDKLAGFGEQFDLLQADLRYTAAAVELLSADLRLGQAKFDLTGAYTRAGADWSSGALRFNVASTGLRLEQIRRAQSYGKALAGEAAVKASGTGEVRKGDFDLQRLESAATLRGVTLEGSRLGNATITARTRDKVLDVKLEGNLRNSQLSGSGEWTLTGDYPGKGELKFSPISFGALQRVAEAAGERTELPFQGRVEGKATITGPLKKPGELRADIELPHIEISPAANQKVRVGGQDLVLRNTQPVLLQATAKSVTVNSARFTAKDTNIEARGRVTFDSKSPWDLELNGGMNLTILQLFNADLLAQGNAVLAANVTGALNDPQVNGKLELHGASLYLGDATTGVDNANGVISFDRNRATIQSLTAEVGGGKVAFGGFIGFNAGLLLYRVQASADQVRIRYPEGVSTTLNAQLDLTGTSANSLVSGTVTVMRAGFTPKADLGALLAQSAKPVTAPSAPNEYLRNIQLDVRIESGPSLQFQTSLTRDLQAEADLRLRGNAARPALIGNVSVNEGEVNIFGTKYTINRGEIRFLNPTRVEPVFDVDLETKARGITVNISFTGSLSKLNLTYRSDPPLQTSEIIALIAVGRDPTTSAALAGGQMTQNSFLETGGSAIGQAIAAPVTSRLQRFFGVSRLKIDPLLTGVENVPEARLTLEQQVSRDITLTYITNLTRTQEQMVRIQWDINREWSAIAVREENGVFGIDFQYRKRFK